MSSCGYSALPNLPLPSPDTNPEEKSEIPIILQILQFY